MHRRLFVMGGLVSGAAALLGTRPGVAREIATPVATPQTDTNPVAEVGRNFRLAQAGFDTLLHGLPVWLDFDVLRYAHRGTAADAIPTLRDNIRLGWRNGSDRAYRFGEPAPVSVRRMGDESHAWSIPITDTRDADNDAILAIVLARKGAIVYTVTGTATSGNPYALLADQTAAMLARRPSDDPLRTDDNGMHHGGLWDVLPTLSDIPEGYRFDADTL